MKHYLTNTSQSQGFLTYLLILTFSKLKVKIPKPKVTTDVALFIEIESAHLTVLNEGTAVPMLSASGMGKDSTAV
jgi:hypothetical protein